MIGIFTVCLISVLLPALLLTLLFRRKNNSFILFPFLLFIQLFNIGLFSILLYSLPYGVLKSFLVFSFSILTTAVFAVTCKKWLPNNLKKIYQPKILIICLILASVSITDIFFIFDKQGFFSDNGLAYFRPPLHDDMIRHVLVTNSLLRKAGSPFLPNTEFLYQLFWHHTSAFLVSNLSEPLSRYHQVAGYSLFIGLVFYFSIFWYLYILRPALFLRRSLLLLFLILAAVHADIYYMILTLIQKGALGIEADWSADAGFLRSFSPKLIAMTAPQHGTFFSFLIGFLVASSRLVRSVFLSRVLFLFCFISSPILSGFFFVPYWFGQFLDSIKLKKTLYLIKQVIIYLVPSVLVHYVLFQFWPWDLVKRPGTSSIIYFVRDWHYLSKLPLLWFGISGLLGLLLIIGLFKIRKTPFTYVVFFGAILFNFFITDVELRRHYSMVVSVFGIFYLSIVWPSFKKYNNSKFSYWVMTSVLIAMPAHFYFLYSYLLKTSVVSQEIPWKDYFDINELIKKKNIRPSIIGVADPKGAGIDYPVIMEVTTSFSMPPHTVIHTKINQERFEILQKIMLSGEVAPHALKLGYQGIIWGPVEEKFWGERVKKRFVREENLIATAGTVKLYRLKDYLIDKYDSQYTESPDFYFKMGQAFEKEIWWHEALGFYYRALELDSQFIDARVAFGRALVAFDRVDEAKIEFEKVLSTNKKRPDIYYELGKINYKEEKYLDALTYFRKAKGLGLDSFDLKSVISEAEKKVTQASK